jgi:hypothetical protein
VTPATPAIHTDGAVSAGAVLWRFRGHLELTVVVKAVFVILPDGVATPAGPGEIVARDRHTAGSPLRSVEAASDLAPYLPRCDVLLTGHAHAPGGAAAGAVRLGVSREGRRLIDKTIHVYGDRGPTGAPEPFTRMPIVYERAVGGRDTANPIGTDAPNLADPEDPRRPACFGPTSRLWPARRALLGRMDHRSLEAPIAEIPEAMPWEYFQAAPRDQQIEPLRGGEWLLLDGLDPKRSRVQTCLPSARGVARVEMRRAGREGPKQSAVELVCDTLAIDGDRQTLSLSWRGRCEVPDGEAALPTLVVLAALEVPGVPVDWARVRAAPAVEPQVKAPVVPVGETTTVPLDHVAAGAHKAMPFMPAPASPPIAVEPRRAPDEIPGAPWSHVAAPPPPRDEEAQTRVLELRVAEAPPPVEAPLPGTPEAWADVPEAPRVAPEPPAPPPMIGPLATAEMEEKDLPPAQEGGRPAAPIAPVAAAKDALPLDAFPIERCAATAASMARRAPDRAKILEENEIGQKTWDALVKHWTESIREETQRGKMALLEAYDRAYVARLEEERGPIRVEEYAGLVVAGERGNAEAALAALTLPRGAMLRIRRVWVGRIAGDAAVGASVREAVEAARDG